jgi:hypothetical protein
MIPSDPNRDPFLLALDRVVRGRTKEMGMSCRDLAVKLGPHYRSFSYWLEGQRKFPADLLPQLCTVINNYELLDLLEHQAGRVAYLVPRIDKLPKTEDIKAVQSLVKEVGKALESLASTLEDGIVEKHELDKTIPALDDVIRECARLKHWLHDHYAADHSAKLRIPPGEGKI